MNKMPKHKDAYYFPHDSNARNDTRVVKLRKDHGIAGYGIYFSIVEMLREANDYHMPIDFETIAYDLRVDQKTIKSVVEDYELFTFPTNGKKGMFSSPSLLQRMKRLDDIRLKRIAAGRKGGKQKPSKAQAKPKQHQATKHNITKHNITIKNIVHPLDELFEKIWIKYPNKDSKAKSKQHFLKTVCNERNWIEINQCLDNYLLNLSVEDWKKPQSAKTWFGNWSDLSWLNFKTDKPEASKNDDQRANLLKD